MKYFAFFSACQFFVESWLNFSKVFQISRVVDPKVITIGTKKAKSLTKTELGKKPG